MIFLGLVKRGYGTLKEIEAMDTPEILDIIEYENIIASIDHYEMEQVKNGCQ